MMSGQEHLPEIHVSSSDHNLPQIKTQNSVIKSELIRASEKDMDQRNHQGLATIQMGVEKGNRFEFEVLDQDPQVNENAQIQMTNAEYYNDFTNLAANSDLQFHLPQKLNDIDANYSRRTSLQKGLSRINVQQSRHSNYQLDSQDLTMIQSKINNLVITTPQVPKNTKTPNQDESQRVLKKQSETVTNNSNPRSSSRTFPRNRDNRRNSRISSNPAQVSSPGLKKIVKKNKNIFQENQMSDQQAIDLLTSSTEYRVSFNVTNLNDLDSTDALDSFIMALLQINRNYDTDYKKKTVQQIHLATGERTEVCRQILTSLVQLQYKESLLGDSVEFFSESLKKMVEVYETNKIRSTQIQQLEETKEELTMKYYDYQKKLTETSTNLLKLRQTSYENTKIIEGLKKQFELKKAECESLTYMLQNIQPGSTFQNEVKVDSEITSLVSKNITPAEKTEFFPEDPLSTESVQVDSLQGQVQRLQIQISQYLNKIKQQHTSIESKDRLITHLESNIASLLVEREESIIKLKSEIVLLQTKVNDGEITFKERLLHMRSRVETEEKKKNKQQIDDLNKTIDSLKNMGADHVSRMQRLQTDYNDLKAEFKNYRNEKTHQEEVRENYLKEIEGKFQFLNQSHQETKIKLNDQIDELQSQLKLKQNEAEVSQLKLKYLRQCAETLYRQKIFILETLKISKQELRDNMAQIQESMIVQNKSKSYLISVEKAIKLIQNMQELGISSLKNFENVVSFFKAEKMHELVFSSGSPHITIEKSEETIATFDVRADLNIQVQSNDSLSPKEQNYTVPLVQKMLDTVKNKIDVPVNFRPKKISAAESKAKKVIKNEEYYLDHCPLEIISILLKFLVEQLAQLEIVQSVEQIPFSISRLLFLANSKSDVQLEKELFESFLRPTKKLLDEEYQALQDQILTHNSLMVLKDTNTKQSRISTLQAEKEDEKIKVEIQTDYSIGPSAKGNNYNVLSMAAFEKTVSQDQVENIKTQDKIIAELLEMQKQQEFQLSKAKIQLEEQKLKSKEIQKALACKIVQLEEDIEIMQVKYEERLDHTEASYRSEIQKIKEGCMKREEILIENQKNSQQRYLDLEAQYIKVTQAFQSKLQHMSNMNAQSVSPTLLLMGKAFSKKVREASEISQQQSQQDKIKRLEQKLDILKDNILTFINIRESTRPIISLVFQTNESNQSMLNQDMIGFYLEKVFKLPKNKFNFLKTFDYVEEQSPKKKQEVVMTQFTFEIMMEEKSIQVKAADVRAAITDGSSLLYDLQPLYISFNFGQSGIGTHHKIKDFQLIKKQGREISNSEFLVSLFRHQENVLVYMVVALDIAGGNEYVVELFEEDIYQLTLGNLDPIQESSSELQDLILENLNLVEMTNGQTLLACEQRIYFNSIGQEAFMPRILQDKRPVTSKFDLSLREPGIKNTAYNKSSIRDQIISQNQREQEHQQREKKTKPLCFEVQCQTEKYESGFGKFSSVYSGIQQVSEQVHLKINIQEASEGNVLMIEFQETNSGKKAKFCIFKEKEEKDYLNVPIPSQLNNIDEREPTPQLPNSKQSFYCHSQCILIAEGHIILACVEKIQDEGLQIKLHDLKMCSSEQLFLIRKSNGQFSKLPPQTDPQYLLIQEEFRNIVYDLSFTYIQFDVKSDIVHQTINYTQEKMIAEGKDASREELFQPNEIKQLKKINPLTIQALQGDHSIYARDSNFLESQLQLQERGILLFRDVMIVRISDLSLRDEDIQQEQFNEKKCLISLYLKNKRINIEVFFYSDQKKLQIIGQFEAYDLIQAADPLKVPFADRVHLIIQMLDHLFVNEEQADKYILKVESEMPPMSQILKQRQLEPGYQKMGSLQPKMSAAQIESLKRTQQNAQKSYEEKLSEFESEKDKYIENDRAKKFQIYCVVGQKANNFPAGANSGLTLKLSIYVLLKKQKTSKGISKRLNTYGKTQLQIENQKLEAFMDDHIEIDSIYIETRDPDSENLINTMIDRKKLVQILVSDFTIDWVNLLMNWKTELISYIQQNIEIDREKSLITIRNKQDTSNLLAAYCKSVVGSKISRRDDIAIIETFADESRELLNRQLVLNQEVDFTEYSYDIKLYKVSRKSAYGEGVSTVGIETLAYHLEIFNLNEPDIVLKFRLPVTASKSNDPVSVFIEVINLSEFSKVKRETSEEINAFNKKLEEDQLRQETIQSKDGIQSYQSENSNKNTEVKPKVRVSKFEQLFKRYVDNQLVLVVQENKFPARISFALLEPSSRLCHKCTFEPANEITQPGSFSLIDAGSLENFFSQVYNITSDDESIQPNSEEKNSDRQIEWNSIQDTKPYHFLSNGMILSKEFKLYISKHRGSFVVQVCDRKKDLLDQSNQFALQSADDSHSKILTSRHHSEDDSPAIEKDKAIYDMKDLKGQFFQDPDCLDESPNLFDIRVKNVFKVQMISKILFSERKDGQSDGSLIIFIETNQKMISVTINNLLTSQTVFSMKLLHEDYKYSKLPLQVIQSITQVRSSLIEAIGLLNTQHLAEETIRRNSKQIDEDEEMVGSLARQKFFHQRNENQKRTIGLHRKVVFDDILERLIVITAEIEIQMSHQMHQTGLVDSDVNYLTLRIYEPEREITEMITMSLNDLINERELASLNRRDLVKLKSVAKRLLEERVEIQKNEDDDTTGNKPGYLLQFKPTQALQKDDGQQSRTVSQLSYSSTGKRPKKEIQNYL